MPAPAFDRTLMMAVVVATSHLLITRVICARSPAPHLWDALPLTGGHSAVFNVCAVALALITAWGICRLVKEEE